MAVTTGAATTAAVNNASATTTFSFVSNGSPLYLVVACWMSTATLNGVTFNTVALTRVVQTALSNANDRVEIWRLTAPAATTANVVLTYSGNNGQSGSIGVYQTSGQDAGTPEGTAASNKSAAGGTGTGNLAITGAAVGDLTIAGVALGNTFAVTPAATGGGTIAEQWDLASNGEESEGFNVPDAVTQVSATFTSASWAIGALVLKGTAAPPPPATTFVIQRRAPYYVPARMY